MSRAAGIRSIARLSLNGAAAGGLIMLFAATAASATPPAPVSPANGATVDYYGTIVFTTAADPNTTIDVEVSSSPNVDGSGWFVSTRGTRQAAPDPANPSLYHATFQPGDADDSWRAFGTFYWQANALINCTLDGCDRGNAGPVRSFTLADVPPPTGDLNQPKDPSAAATFFVGDYVALTSTGPWTGRGGVKVSGSNVVGSDGLLQGGAEAGFEHDDNQDNNPVQHYQPVQLNTPGTTYWQPYRDNCKGTSCVYLVPGGISSLSVLDFEPTKPISPTGGQLISTSSPQFVWASALGVMTVSVYTSLNAALGGYGPYTRAETAAESRTQTSVYADTMPRPLDWPRTYYWTVDAATGTGATSEGDVQSFRVGPPRLRRIRIAVHTHRGRRGADPGVAAISVSASPLDGGSITIVGHGARVDRSFHMMRAGVYHYNLTTGCAAATYQITVSAGDMYGDRLSQTRRFRSPRCAAPLPALPGVTTTTNTQSCGVYLGVQISAYGVSCGTAQKTYARFVTGLDTPGFACVAWEATCTRNGFFDFAYYFTWQ